MSSFKNDQNPLEHTWFLAATPIVLFFDPNDMTDLEKMKKKKKKTMFHKCKENINVDFFLTDKKILL